MPVCPDTTIPSHITLTFSSIVIGEHVHKLVSTPQRAEAVNKVSNFWASTGVLDGRYPCLFWEHNFSVYESGLNRWDFALKYFSKATQHFGGSPQSLLVVVSGSSVIDFGSCYLEGYSVESPDNLLGYGAGIYSLKFTGTSIPTVLVTTPTP